MSGRHRLLTAVAVLFFALALVVALALPLLWSEPSLEWTPTLTFEGGWDVNGTQAFVDERILVRGNLTVRPGGVLRLSGTQLKIEEPNNLARRMRVEGTLEMDAGSVSTTDPARHLWIEARANSTVRLKGVVVRSLGGPSPPDREGLLSWTNGLRISNCTFRDYHVAVRILGGRNLLLDGNRFLDTVGGPDAYSVSVERASEVRIEDNEFAPNADTGALLIRSPDNLVARNRFELPAVGRVPWPVSFSYDYAANEGPNRTTFADNDLRQAGLYLNGASDVLVRDNRIDGTGAARWYGIRAIVQIGTPPGLWSRNLTIEGNTISNFTRYAIRLEQNVSHSVVRANRIFAPEGRAFGEAYGIYLIRAVENVTVSGNDLDMRPPAGVRTLGVSLEARVYDCRVENNTIRDASQHGVNVQGYDDAGDPPWYHTGPSLRNVVANNTIVLTRPVAQRTHLTTAVVTWLWANRTIIENNVVRDYALANDASWHNGAFLLTSSSLQTVRGNRIENATWGFVFKVFVPAHENPAAGSFNRSANVVYGNTLRGLSRPIVSANESDGMGPVRNVILAASDRLVDGLPELHFEGTEAIRSLAWESNGTSFAATMRAAMPTTGHVEALAASVPFEGPPLRFSVAGGLDRAGTRAAGYGLAAFPGTGWSYRIATTSPTRHSVSVRELGGTYNVSVRAGAVSSDASVRSSDGGLLAFAANASGSLSVNASFAAPPPARAPLPGTVVVETNLPGREILVDDTPRISPFHDTWDFFGAHRVEAPPAQRETAETREAWRSWNDGGPRAHDATLALDSTTEEALGLPADPDPFGGGDYATHLFDAPNRFRRTYGGGAPIVEWTWSFPTGSDVDFAVFRDTNCDGVYSASDGVSGLAAATAFNPESVRLIAPEVGCYYVHASGADVPPGATFDERMALRNTSSPTRIVAQLVRQFRVTVAAEFDTEVRVDGVWFEGPNAFWFDEGSAHELYARPSASGGTFRGWSDGEMANPRVLQVTAAGTLTARYTGPLTLPVLAVVGALVAVAVVLLMWRRRRRRGEGSRGPPAREEPPSGESPAHNESDEAAKDPAHRQDVDLPSQREADD